MNPTFSYFVGGHETPPEVSFFRAKNSRRLWGFLFVFVFWGCNDIMLFLKGGS